MRPITEGHVDKGFAPDPQDQMPWLCGAYHRPTGAACDLKPWPHEVHEGWALSNGFDLGCSKIRHRFTDTYGRVAHRGEKAIPER